MSKKYIELKKDRVAILDYHFGIDENSETFKELKEDAIIPVELWSPVISVMVLHEVPGGTNKLSGGDIKAIHDAICSLKPNEMTVAEWFS